MYEQEFPVIINAKSYSTNGNEFEAVRNFFIHFCDMVEGINNQEFFEDRRFSIDYNSIIDRPDYYSELAPENSKFISVNIKWVSPDFDNLEADTKDIMLIANTVGAHTFEWVTKEALRASKRARIHYSNEV